MKWLKTCFCFNWFILNFHFYFLHALAWCILNSVEQSWLTKSWQKLYVWKNAYYCRLITFSFMIIPFAFEYMMGLNKDLNSAQNW